MSTVTAAVAARAIRPHRFGQSTRSFVFLARSHVFTVGGTAVDYEVWLLGMPSSTNCLRF